MSQMCGMGMPGGMGDMPGMGGGFAPNNGAAGGQASRQPTPTPAPQAYDVIPPGTIVSLKGLVKASHHNGDRGVIRKYAQSNGRYMVELEDPDNDDVKTMAVKPKNLLQHVHVRIHDIVSQPAGAQWTGGDDYYMGSQQGTVQYLRGRSEAGRQSQAGECYFGNGHGCKGVGAEPTGAQRKVGNHQGLDSGKQQVRRSVVGGQNNPDQGREDDAVGVGRV